MKRIIWFRDGDRCTAMLADQPGAWSVGSTAAEAIGSMLMTFPGEFDIEIQEAKRK